MSMSLQENIAQLGVYQVYTGSGTGTGWLIDATHLLTNAHVVEPYREVAVELRNRLRVRGQVMRLHPERDLAIVRLDQALDGTVLNLGEDELSAKQSVHILGFPIGLPLSVTEGVVSHPNQRLDGQFFVQTDAAINPGNSGGPILNDDQRVVAVTTCKLDSADAVGFGIPIRDVKIFIEGFRAQTAAFGVQCPECEVLIEKARRYCDECGANLEEKLDFSGYFSALEAEPLSDFVESALTRSGLDPVLARHGFQNWSTHAGSAPVKIWSCCSEHVNFSAALGEAPTKKLGALFEYLLDAGHAPFAFDLESSTIRMNFVVHSTDIFTQTHHEALLHRVTDFMQRADQLDDVLIEKYGCTPAQDSQIEFEGKHG